MTKQEIGQILRVAREAKGFTQKQVAELLGRKQQIVGHWETGYSQPDANTLFELCDLYDLSIDEAFGKKPVSTNEGNVSPEYSADDIALLNAINDLDAPGRAAVQAVLESEQQRIKEYGPAVKRTTVALPGRIPMMQMTHESVIQIGYQSKQEQRELEQTENLTSDPT